MLPVALKLDRADVPVYAVSISRFHSLLIAGEMQYVIVVYKDSMAVYGPNCTWKSNCIWVRMRKTPCSYHVRCPWAKRAAGW